MTIKARNRYNLIFTIIAIAVFVLQLIFLTQQIYIHNFELPEVYLKSHSSFYLFKYNPLFVIIGIFLLEIYVILTSFFINQNFEKTQSTEITFFLLFLAACLFDSLRLLVPLLKVEGTYSKLLMEVGYVPLFARILAPLSLLGTTILCDEESRHNVDRNCIFIIITSLFFAKLIPFNTAIILPNFCVSYGYTQAIRYCSFFICVASLSALFISNKKNEYGQRTTLGFLFIALGYSNMFICYNLFHLIFGPIFLGLGSLIYLKSLHKQYMWLD